MGSPMLFIHRFFKIYYLLIITASFLHCAENTSFSEMKDLQYAKVAGKFLLLDFFNKYLKDQ
jgi:hypothetical protein